MTENQISVYFSEDNKVVIEKNNDIKIEVSQKEAKIILLKLYSMFTDENAKKFFPEPEGKSE